MVTLIQGGLLALLALTTYLVVGVLHGSWLVAGLLGLLLLAVLWVAYLVWQARHPEWWAPWDEGLPQVMRMTNVFIPVLMIFVFAFICLVPMYERAQQQKRKRQGPHSQTSATLSKKAW